MESASTTPEASNAVIKEENKRYFTFFQVIVTLVAVTFLELILVVLPFARSFLLTSLAVLSAVKFIAVIWYFMHLRWDKKLLTGLFILGLILAGGTLTALLFLFPTDPQVAEQYQEMTETTAPAGH